jgi:hypothetical protein
MKIGRKIYYDITTGNVIIDTGEMQGAVIATTIEDDIESFISLSERNRETFDVLELEYGQYVQDFAECNGYRVIPETKELEFSYHDQNEPEAPQIFQRPLFENVNENMDYLLDVDFRLSMVELGLI